MHVAGKWASLTFRNCKYGYGAFKLVFRINGFVKQKISVSKTWNAKTRTLWRNYGDRYKVNVSIGLICGIVCLNPDKRMEFPLSCFVWCTEWALRQADQYFVRVLPTVSVSVCDVGTTTVIQSLTLVAAPRKESNKNSCTLFNAITRHFYFWYNRLRTSNIFIWPECLKF